MKQKWYLQTWFICLFFLFSIYVFPVIIGIILLVLQIIENKRINAENRTRENLLAEIGVSRYEEMTEKIQRSEAEWNSRKSLILKEYNDIESDLNKAKEDLIKKIKLEQQDLIDRLENDKKTIEVNNTYISEQIMEIERLKCEVYDYEKQKNSLINKLAKIKELYHSIDHACKNFFNLDIEYDKIRLRPGSTEELETLSPSVILKLHSMDIKDLKKAFTENQKIIDNLLKQYSDRYTTKANKSIYDLMVIALKAELQNVLYNLKYQKLDDSVDNIKKVTQKYLAIAATGNQSIASTITKFVGEAEYLFINAAKIEYNYYVKKELIKAEQQAIRQQMREEAAERKLLEQQRKQIEQEEEKYKIELQKLNDALSSTTSDTEIDNLKNRILELEGHLSEVFIKKDEITKLQNGKAGYVYIISNLGSFSEDVFKVGMTRRLNPQERIDELGSASVPFRFDVHSLIFSNNAVELESKIHMLLNEKRVNKVNTRKEFFKVGIEEIESLVFDLEPTAEFSRTMLAEEYRQSISTDNIYTFSSDSDGEDNDGDDLEDDELFA